MDIGPNIRRARLARGLTQHELSLRAGQREISISHWECGRRRPRLEQIESVAHALGMTAGELVDGTWAGDSKEDA